MLGKIVFVFRVKPTKTTSHKKETKNVDRN